MNLMQRIYVFFFFVSTCIHGKTDPFLNVLAANKSSKAQTVKSKKPTTTKKVNKKLTREDIEELGFRYINNLEYEEISTYFPEVNESQLSIAERKNRQKYQQLIEEGYESPWYVQYVNDKVGYGAFAADDIEAGQLVGEYTGVIFDQEYFEQHNTRDMKYVWTLPAPSNFKNPSLKFMVDAGPVGNFVRFVNHSYHPNVIGITVYCQKEWHMIYVANRAIKKDEQLLVDYGRGYWQQRGEPDEMSIDV